MSGIEWTNIGIGRTGITQGYEIEGYHGENGWLVRIVPEGLSAIEARGLYQTIEEAKAAAVALASKVLG